MRRLWQVEALVELHSFVATLAVEADSGHTDSELALVAADRTGIRNVDGDLLEAAREKDLRACCAELVVGGECVDERPQPVGRDGRIVVHERDEVELAGRSDPEVAAAREPRVGERLDDPHRRKFDCDTFDDVVERAVVDHHDLHPVGRIVGRQQRFETVDRHLPAVVVDDDDAYERGDGFHQWPDGTPVSDQTINMATWGEPT